LRELSLPKHPAVCELAQVVVLDTVAAVMWARLGLPARTPSAIVGRLNAETVKVLGRTDVKGTLTAQGLEVAPGSPEQFAAHIKNEIARFTQIVKAAGIKAE